MTFLLASVTYGIFGRAFVSGMWLFPTPGAVFTVVCETASATVPVS